ncbi:MAG: dihydrofolate reductase [Atopobiaceae bacterium]|jgi:dihydrofolate reductase|nr:dihydrofolate reductase [Atopobiaceae bacterium]MCH4213790.1 dihydrofolate reductase [Atopobiaceae bacterium]MCH4229785.1 dihydrofolate reductase [Atopobiaceae bacterium]MCI1226709.1 dihydrofolate reductase [Atopobiaceae bacterium]MCI1260521.1 dihydrofolate reductase [Atopobiaceae bacterium]
MNAVVATCDDWGIGHKGQLLVANHDDMRHFVSLTTGGTCIMGRKTQEGLPGARPLKNRRNIVLTRDEATPREGFELAHGVRDALRMTAQDEDVWVIGGEAVYRTFLPYCERVFVTRNRCTRPADAFFPDLTKIPGWELEETHPGGVTDEGVPFSFETYLRIID